MRMRLTGQMLSGMRLLKVIDMTYIVIIKLKNGVRHTCHVKNVENVIEARDFVIDSYGGKDNVTRCLAVAG
jgi:hypothetical protein